MAAQKGPRRSEGKERFWRRMVLRQRRSGQSVRAWCQRQGVSEPSFYAWRRELVLRDAAVRAPALLPVTIAAPSLAAPLEIAWPGGVVVRVSVGCDARLLRETLQVLRSLSAEPRSQETRPC